MPSDKEFFEDNANLLDSILTHKQADKDLVEYDIFAEKIKTGLLTGAELMKLPYEPNDYLVEGLLWRNDIAFLIAKEKAGKSIFSTQMACALTCGLAFLDTFEVAKPMNVLYIQAEGTLYTTQERLRSALSKGGVKWDKKRWRHLFPPALALDTEEGYDDILKRIKDSDFNPDIIIIDPLYMAMAGALTDDTPCRRFCRNIRRLQEEFNCSFIIVHHEHRGKKDGFGRTIEEGDNSIMGSFVWKAFASHVLRITWDIKTGIRKVKCSTQRSGNVSKEVELKLKNDPLMFELTGGAPSGATEDSVLTFIRYKKEASAPNIRDEIGMNIQTVRNCMSRLKTKGLIRIKRKKGNQTFYEVN